MENNSLKSKVLNGMFWKLLEQTGYQGIQFVVALVLARLMTPREYGTISLITIFITIANTFVQSGFATALIQKDEIHEEDYSSVFWLSMLLALLCYIVLLVAAPWIAIYYHTPVLTELIRVMGLVLFPGAVISIQTARISRKLQFRKLFQATMIAVLLSGVISIMLAFRGFGVWAMAAQQMIYYFALMASLFLFTRWFPKLLLEMGRIRVLFSFGWKILVSGLIDTIWQNIYGLVIGKKYSSAELGVYNRGEQFPKILTGSLTAAVQSVMLPAYARKQKEPETLRRMCRRSIQFSAFIVFPMMAGLIAVARPLVLLLLTEKWIDAAPYLALLCLGYALLPMDSINLQLMNAMGRSDLFLRLEIIKKALGILVLVLSLPFGIMPMLIMKIVDEYLCLIINALPNGKLIGYGPAAQLRDLLPAAVCAALMGAGAWAVQLLKWSPLWTLMLQIPVGVVLYLFFSFLFNRASFDYTYGLILKYIQRSPQ
jgi:O-antigen/teichoic acid export membrane protein